MTSLALAPKLASSNPPRWPALTRCVLPSSPGGAIDALMRGLGQSLGGALETTFVVEHRPGAAGLLAAQAVSRAPADGSVLLYLHAGHVTLQAMGARLNLLEDLSPVTQLHVTPHMLAVAAGSAVRTVSDLREALGSGSMSYGSGGHASPSHLVVERLLARWPGVPRPLHVPFKSPTEAAAAVAARSVDFCFALPGTLRALVEADRLRALAVASATRSAVLAQVPTFDEAGVDGFRDEPWGGLALPAGTAMPIVERLAFAVHEAAASADVARALLLAGSSASLSESPPLFAEQIRNQVAEQRPIVEQLGLRLP